MVRTRIDLKHAIKCKIQSISQPFKTGEIVEYARHIAPNVYLNANRVAKYIQAADEADFNKSKRVWTPRSHIKKDGMEDN